MWLAWVQDLLLSLLEHLGLSLRRDCKVHECTFLNGLRMPPLFFTFKGQAQSHKHASDVCLTFIWGGIFLLCLIRTSGTLKKEHKPNYLTKPGFKLCSNPNLVICLGNSREVLHRVDRLEPSRRRRWRSLWSLIVKSHLQGRLDLCVKLPQQAFPTILFTFLLGRERGRDEDQKSDLAMKVLQKLPFLAHKSWWEKVAEDTNANCKIFPPA